MLLYRQLFFHFPPLFTVEPMYWLPMCSMSPICFLLFTVSPNWLPIVYCGTHLFPIVYLMWLKFLAYCLLWLSFISPVISGDSTFFPIVYCGDRLFPIFYILGLPIIPHCILLLPFIPHGSNIFLPVTPMYSPLLNVSPFIPHCMFTLAPFIPRCLL